MPRRKQLRPTDLLAPLEAQVMAAIWRHPDLSAVEATELVNARRDEPLSHYTILTTMKRLEAKGCVAHRADGKFYRFTAVVPEDEFVTWHGRQQVKALQERYGPDIIVPGLIGSERPDPAVLARLRELLALVDDDPA